MLKRQDTGLSSSRREMPAPPPSNNHHHNAKSVGCMSGIFHLLSKYQHRHRRKFLTFGKKHDKVVQHPPSTKQNPTTKKVPQHDDVIHIISPSIQPEIRKSTTSSHSPEVQLRSSPPSLPPRIIKPPESKPLDQSNLEISTTNNTNSTISYEERRKLVFDLEKCDEDLKELQRIIESVRYSGRVLSPSPTVNRSAADEKSRGEKEDVRIKYSVVNEQPSPVSVLDELTRSPLISNIYLRRETTTTKNGRMATPQQHKATPRKKDEANLNSLFVQKFRIESVVQARRERGRGVPPPRSSKAMMESVEEVCKDIAWGEKREVGRLGIVIQDYICRDLIEEFVKDLEQQHSSYNNANFFYSLPFQACRKRLCF